MYLHTRKSTKSLVSVINLLKSTITVSYTHLDVYKRQFIDRVFVIFDCKRRNAQRKHHAEDKQQCRNFSHFHAQPSMTAAIVKITVEIIVNVHAADLGLHTEQKCAASAERLQVQLRAWREHLPDVWDQLFLAADPGDKRSSDPGHPRPRLPRISPLPAPSRKLPHPDRHAFP